MRDTTAGVSCWESFVPGGSIGAACWESFVPVRPAGVSCGESFVPQVVLCAVQSSPCSACLCRRREIVLPASEKWLGIAVLWCVGRVLSRVAHWGCLLGEFYTGSARRVSCGESFVPGGSIGAACWESFVPVRPAGVSCGESFVPVVHLTCGAGRVLSRSSGETARSEGVRGLRGMYLRCRRAAARLESGARPAGPGRASRRRAERSSRRGRRAGGQASHRTEIWQASRHTEVWRLGASRTASGRAAAHRRIEQTQTTGCAGRDRLLRGPVLLSSHPQLVLL